MMVIDNKFNISEIVYLRTDVDQSPRVVCSISVYPTELVYNLSCGTVQSGHYGFEISTEKNLLM